MRFPLLYIMATKSEHICFDLVGMHIKSSMHYWTFLETFAGSIRTFANVLLAAARKLATSREILLWMTPSEAPKALQASECSELLDPTRASCWISAQHQPGKFNILSQGFPCTHVQNSVHRIGSCGLAHCSLYDLPH